MKGKAIGYTRVSTGAQASSGLGIKAQEAEIRRFCAYKELELVYIYQDGGVTGGMLLKQRPSGQALWAALEESDEDPWSIHLVASKLGRLWRSRAFMHVELAELERMQVNVHTAKNGRTLITGGEGADREAQAYANFFTEITALFDEVERIRASERTAEALQVKRERGEHIGAVPYGYERQGSDLGPNEADMSTLGMIWHFHESRGMTYRDVALELNRRKRRPHSRSKDWSMIAAKKQGARLRKNPDMLTYAKGAFVRYLERAEAVSRV